MKENSTGTTSTISLLSNVILNLQNLFANYLDVEHYVTFKREGLILKGKFFLHSNGSTRPTILLLQGSPGNPDDVLGLGVFLAKSGYNAFTFNYAGTLESEGEFSFENNQADIHAAVEFLTDQYQTKQFNLNPSIIIGGYSHGGGMSLIYLSRNPRIKSGFNIAGTDFGQFMEEYEQSLAYREMVDSIFAQFKESNIIRVASGWTPREVFERNTDISAFDLRKLVPRLVGRNILIIGGWEDSNIKIDSHLLPLYRLLQGIEGKVRIEALHTDHSFTNVREQLHQTIINWLRTSDV